MKYKALIEIGGYKPGDEVPEDKARVWESMYKVSPVERVSGDGSSVEVPESVSEPEAVESSEPESSSDPMLDDYLGRNSRTVVDAVEKDELSKEQLNKLLELEKSDKNRKAVISAIEKRLEE